MKQHKSVAVTIVIPAYMAADSIEATLRGFARLADRVIVVDDGSSDDTGRRVLQAGHANVILLRHDRNRGVGAAVKTGFEKALALGTDVVVKVDADGQMEPAWFGKLIAPLLNNRADVTKGNRWSDPIALVEMPGVRRYGNLVLGFFTRLASGHWHVFDPNNGYVAWRAELLRKLDFHFVPDRFTFEAGMLVETGLLGAVVQDVGIPARYESESSHLSVSAAPFQFSLFLLRATFRRIWRRYFVQDFNAVSLFLLAGGLLGTFGVLFGAWKWYESIRSGVPATAGTVILSALPVAMGFGFLLQALVLDINLINRRGICSELPVAGHRRNRTSVAIRARSRRKRRPRARRKSRSFPLRRGDDQDSGSTT